MNEKRVALVTGGSRGIGAAIVKRLAHDGFHVVAVARTADKLAAVEGVAEKLGRIDVLVNNAGITRDGLILRMDDEDFDAVIAVNLKSAFVTIRAASRPMMRAKGGRIINISSVSGVAGNAGQSNYAASKAGLIGLTKSVAKEFAGKNITANVIAPGFITTDMTDILAEPIKEGARAMIPMRRFGSPQEIASVVSFFAGPDGSYITGQVICVDGGMVM